MPKKKALLAIIQQLEIENKHLRSDNGHWIWVVDQLFRHMTASPSRYWERADVYSPRFPDTALKTPYTISYIAANGRPLNLLVVHDYRDEEDDK